MDAIQAWHASTTRWTMPFIRLLWCQSGHRHWWLMKSSFKMKMWASSCFIHLLHTHAVIPAPSPSCRCLGSIIIIIIILFFFFFYSPRKNDQKKIIFSECRRWRRHHSNFYFRLKRWKALMTFIWKTFDLVFWLFYINTRFNVFYLIRQIIPRSKAKCSFHLFIFLSNR